jgi:hypothetical protein
MLQKCIVTSPLASRTVTVTATSEPPQRAHRPAVPGSWAQLLVRTG